MKAVRIHEYGDADVLRIDNIERPVPAADEILIKVFASGINPVDFAIRGGKSAALSYHLSLPMTLGWDAAGIIEETGTDVTTFKKGDAVYGVPNFPAMEAMQNIVQQKPPAFPLFPKVSTLLKRRVCLW